MIEEDLTELLKDVERDQVEVVLEAQVGFVLKDGEGDAGDVGCNAVWHTQETEGDEVDVVLLLLANTSSDEAHVHVACTNVEGDVMLPLLVRTIIVEANVEG